MMVDGARHGANKKMGQFAHFFIFMHCGDLLPR